MCRIVLMERDWQVVEATCQFAFGMLQLQCQCLHAKAISIMSFAPRGHQTDSTLCQLIEAVKFVYGIQQTVLKEGHQ